MKPFELDVGKTNVGKHKDFRVSISKYPKPFLPERAFFVEKFGGVFMKTTDLLYLNAKDIWDSYYEHPFVKGIENGSLEIDKFRFYMLQDYLYLLDYAKVFALGVAKAENEDVMRIFSNLVNSTLNSEMNIHKSYMKRLGITKEETELSKQSFANKAYTSYMLWVSYNYSISSIAAAVLSCSWSYKLIADNILKNNPKAAEHELFGEWISGYSSPEYEEGNEEIINLVNYLTKNSSKEEIEILKEIFVNCSRYEYMFWDMAFNKEI